MSSIAFKSVEISTSFLKFDSSKLNLYF